MTRARPSVHVARLTAALPLVASAACFSPTYDAPACSPAGDCPEGLVCRADVCVAPIPGTDAAIDAAEPDTGGSDAEVDASVAVEDLPYVEPAHEYAGTGDWTVSGNINFDTGNPSFATPAGVTFSVQSQSAPDAPALLVLHVRRFEIAQGGTLGLYGSRALVVIAGEDVVVSGVIDASAGAGVAGPGAYTGVGLPGTGAPGQVPATGNSDTGGGGGGHGTQGGRGGGAGCTGDVCTVAFGAGGGVVNSGLVYLGGGGPGGLAPSRASCIAGSGGAGGGAVLIYSTRTIAVTATGRIEANGGGGAGGKFCPAVGTLAGAGGGAGGHVELMAPNVDIAGGGMVVANGGAGGGGSNNSGAGADGAAGADGTDSVTVAASGGQGNGTGGTGGAGSIGGAAGGAGQDVALGANAGGGGGGAGLIVIRHRGAPPTATTSPPARLVVY